ncbi:hypothetical protein HYU14_04895 [Candidatus Woesearchaeota archaeon]|nr:hypothetical protein [Candidatus Woesearchaeota archaeon]
MPETTFEKQVLVKLEHMEKAINHITALIEDPKLSLDDKAALRIALQEEGEGKLFSKKEVFEGISLNEVMH